MTIMRNIIKKIDKIYTNICIDIYFKTIIYLHLEDDLIYKVNQ